MLCEWGEGDIRCRYVKHFVTCVAFRVVTAPVLLRNLIPLSFAWKLNGHDVFPTVGKVRANFEQVCLHAPYVLRAWMLALRRN
jgi:hypothetical protein